MPEDVSNQTPSSQGPEIKTRDTGHERHCFVVMPFGRTPAEIRWYKGWYDVVLKVAVQNAGFEPRLSATEEQPSAINDEIRAHLTFDPMVVVDLGGATPESDPNPNVMYELGIRHALGLLLVMVAWQGQRLPFDVGNQRVILEGRELLDLETNRARLTKFILAAAAGNYYRPMEAVGRVAALDVASATLGEDSVLGALVKEVKELRAIITGFASRPDRPLRPFIPTLKRVLRRRTFRKSLYAPFLAAGGTPTQWGELINSPLPPDVAEKSLAWGEEDWRNFVEDQAKQWAALSPEESPISTTSTLQSIKDIESQTEEAPTPSTSPAPARPLPSADEKTTRPLPEASAS